MGNTASDDRMGERVAAGRRKLEHELKKQEARVRVMNAVSPDTMEVMVQSIEDAFHVHAPFKEGTLMAAFRANPQRVEHIVTESCKEVLSSPIEVCSHCTFHVR